MADKPDPQTVREIAREAIRSASQRLELIDGVIARHRAIGDRPASGSGELMAWHATYSELCRAVRAQMQAASWPDEQPAAEQDGDEAAGRLEAFLEFYGPDDEIVGYTQDFRMNVADLRAALADRKQLAARVAELEAENARMREELEQLRTQRAFLDGQVFVSGWDAHAEACASLGWDAREAAWRKYREEMAATLAKAESAPQQPERRLCSCGCHPGGDCSACSEWHAGGGSQQPERDTADGGAQ